MKKSVLRKLIREEIQKTINEGVNDTLTNGGYDKIDDPALENLANQVLDLIGGNPSPEAVNSLVMAIEDAQGGNIEF
jgi:hypothetical protein